MLLNRVTDQHVLVYLNEPTEPTTLNTQELNRQELKTSNERQEIPQTEIPTETVNEPSVIKEISKRTKQNKRIVEKNHYQNP